MPDRKIFLRDPKWLPSLESLFGWHSQFERMMRWHDRLRREPSLDMLLTFFLNSYALRDWLIKSSTIASGTIDAEIDSDFAMRLCRDLCNRSKHLTINKPSVDADFAITMEYRGKTRPAGIVVLAGGVKSDLHEVADQCVDFWRRILSQNGLLPL